MAQIDTFFKQLISQQGSDLHLQQGQLPKIRINGHLQPLEGGKILKEEELVVLLKEIPSPQAWEHFKHSGDLDFAYSLGEEARFRANYCRQFHGYEAVFRLIPSHIKTLDELQMPPVLKTFGENRSGLILVTGPTGSGKSTTLAAIIDHINTTQKKKIVTIEEPVEFIHKNKQSIMIHREVGLDTESFTTGLQGAIKSDANVILVGEMRDRETINLALIAAEMGILVFGTLHTNSAPKTVDRIIDVFPNAQKNQIRSTLANSLRGVVSQQLLRSIDGTKRLCAYEIMLRTPALVPIIRKGETIKLVSEIQLNSAKGMILMDDCLRRLIAEGKISKEEASMKGLDRYAFFGKMAEKMEKEKIEKMEKVAKLKKI